MAIRLVMAKCFGANTGCYSVLGATSSQLGASFGSAESNYVTNAEAAVNRAIQVDAKTILVWINNQIYRSTDAGANWASVKTQSTVNANNYLHSGLYHFEVSNALVVGGVYINSTSANFVALATSDNGTTWSETNLSAASPGSIYDEFVYNNRLFVMTSTGGTQGLFAWDPSTNGSEAVTAVTGAVVGGNIQAQGTWCTHNGILYRFGYSSTGNGATQNFSLWRYNNGTLTEIAAFIKQAGNNLTDDGSTSKQVMFDDIDGNMYAIFMFAGGAKIGLTCNKIAIDATTGVATITDVTSSVIPSALQWTNNGTTNTVRVRVVRDNETNPGGLISLIYHAPSVTSTTWSQYRWNNWYNVTLTSATGFNVGDSVTSGSATGVIMTLSGSVIGICPTNGVAFATSGSITDTTTSNTTTFNSGAFTLSTMTLQDTGLDVTIMPPHSADEGAGARTLQTGGDFFVKETNRTRVTNGIQFSIKVSGITGSETVSVFPYFNAFTTAPNQPMTIASVTGGSATLNANSHQIDNVTADGTTTYTFIWLTGTDAVPVGRKARVAMRAA